MYLTLSDFIQLMALICQIVTIIILILNNKNNKK